MNEFKISDIHLDMKASYEYLVTKENLDLFTKITGDINPMHVDSTFAKNHNMKDKIVYGMLTSSLLSTLAGVYLPGKYCLLQEVNTKFLSPVYVGDLLKVEGQVVNISESVKQLEIKVQVINQNNEKVLKGIIKTGFTE